MQQPPSPATAVAGATDQTYEQKMYEMNGSGPETDEAISMEVDSPILPGETSGVDLDHNPMDIERVLAFGRDLQSLFSQVTASKPNDKLKTMLQVPV